MIQSAETRLDGTTLVVRIPCGSSAGVVASDRRSGRQPTRADLETAA
jgi:hypothetical protein